MKMCYYHPSDHDHIWPQIFTDRKNIQKSHDPQHDVKAVHHVSRTTCGRVEPETETNKKQHDCDAVQDVPLVGGPFFAFVSQPR